LNVNVLGHVSALNGVELLIIFFVFIFASTAICVHGIFYHSAWMYVTYSKKFIFVGRARLTVVDVVAICCALFLWSHRLYMYLEVLHSLPVANCSMWEKSIPHITDWH